MILEIDLGAYSRNLAFLKERLAPAELMAVVKDDAYGHGLDRIIPVALAEGIVRFAVLDIETGIQVRALVGDRNIQLFAWLFEAKADFSAARAAGIDFGVSQLDVLEAVACAGGDEPARVHLKIDTGLHRNGASVSAWPTLVNRAAELTRAGLIDVVGVWSHIGEASDAEDEKSRVIFEDAIHTAVNAGLHIRQRHLAASAASFERQSFRYDFARVGGFTYGVAPGDGISPANLGLEPVMTARAHVERIEHLKGQTHAVVNAGAVDGIPDWTTRSLESPRTAIAGFEVVVANVRVPVVEVGLHNIRIDISDVSGVVVGSVVTLFGSHLAGAPVLQEWADALGTVGEEIVVRVGPQALRKYAD
jgi:alanine racemase